MQNRRGGRCGITWGGIIALALCAALAGCGGGPQDTGATAAGATPSPTATATATAQPQPTVPVPTPLPAGTLIAYSNTAYHFTIEYPTNWIAQGATATSQSFMVFNYDPQTYQQPIAPPPLLKIEIDVAPNPNHQTPSDFFTSASAGPGQPTPTILSSQAAQVAGRDGQKIVYTTSQSPTPIIMYLVPNGDSMFLVSQTNAQNSQPSAVFTQMLASFTFTA